MNIFFLSWDPEEAARFHCDKHVVKMIIETAQLLYSAHWVLRPDDLPPTAYKLAHKNHPCSIWVRRAAGNYKWLVELGLCICKEYQHRYGEHKTHKTEAHLLWLKENVPYELPNLEMTTPAQAMPEEYKNDNTIVAYRTFYIESKLKKRGIVRYTKREWPKFLKEEYNGGDRIQTTN